MKKFLSAILLISTLLFTSCSMFYSIEWEGKYEFGYSERLNRAFIGEVEYSMEDGTDIVLPETYNGYDVKELGGYMGRGYPCPFYISVTEWSKMAEEEDAVFLYSDMDEVNERIANGETLEYNDLKLNVTLPPLLKEISNCRMNYVSVLEEKNGEKLETPVVYRILFSFTIDEDNKYFYTDDGKLYYKRTKKLVEEFLYQ